MAKSKEELSAREERMNALKIQIAEAESKAAAAKDMRNEQEKLMRVHTQTAIRLKDELLALALS